MEQRRVLYPRGQGKTKNKDKIDKIDEDIKLLQKYRGRIKIIPEGMKTIKKVLVIRNQRRNPAKKFKKLGSGVVYFNDANDLINRMELLGGSILAGNNGVKEEFSQIAHKLNQLGLINNKQLIDLLQQYIM